nr:hypothetical protein [Tanacetum cinerariifolium]
MGTLSLVSEYLKDLEECMDDGDPTVANWRLFDGYCFEDTLRDVYRNNLMKKKCIWFRLCGHRHILTLPECAIVLGLFIEDESREVNLAWIIADHLYKHALKTKENSVICAGHYVTKIACFLGYYVDDEIKKCSEPIDCEYWISKMLVDELDAENTCLKKETKMLTQAEEGSRKPRQEHEGLNSSWGDWNASLSEIKRGNIWRDFMLIRNNYMLEHSMPILHHLADQGNFAYPTYKLPNVPPYPYPYHTLTLTRITLTRVIKATKEEAMDWVVMITSRVPC